jgi:hypothetical protein
MKIKLESVFQFEVIFSNKTIAIQRIWTKFEEKRNWKTIMIFYMGSTQTKVEEREMKEKKENQTGTKLNRITIRALSR